METPFGIVSFSPWNPRGIITLSPFLGLAFLFFLEHWMLHLPKPLPWTLPKTGIFPRVSACLKDLLGSMKGLQSGYVKFGSQGKFFVKPDILFRPIVMIPREHIRWAIEQPDDVLSTFEARYEKFALRFVLPEQNNTIDRIFVDTIRRKMTRFLGKLQPILAKEVSTNLDNQLKEATTDGWTEVKVLETADRTVHPAVMRFLVGNTINNDWEFKRALERFTKAYFFASIVIGGFLPKPVKPYLGWVISIYSLMRQNAVLKFLVPMVEERVNNTIKKMNDPSFKYDPPEDTITWTSEALIASGSKCSPYDFCRRLAILMPAAVPTIRMTVTNFIFDMLSSPPEWKVQEHLYKEIVDALEASPEGWSDQFLLGRLNFLNSAIRESLRLNPTSIVAHEKKVMPKEGIDLPSGVHLPQGAWLGVPIVGVHADDNVYPNAAQWQPWRFCNCKPGEPTDEKEVASTPIVNVTESFLTFGVGSYSCPGRWLASHVLKLTIAYLIYNYELKPNFTHRPHNVIMFGYNSPDRHVTMSVRRRKH